ncbi:hydantoinase B/oxoprolinase family protein, partial [Rhizobiaceae sp. 2RAB30]
AGHFASICGTVIAGDHPDTGRRFTMVEPQMGGWGATAVRDGLDAMYSTSHGETFNCPVEICEARYGIDVGHKKLNDTDEGQGRHRGGKGLSVTYRPRGPAMLSAGYSRNRQAVWGLAGGGKGGTNGLSVRRRDGKIERHAFVSGLVVEPGDEILIDTANGGGWGKSS